MEGLLPHQTMKVSKYLVYFIYFLLVVINLWMLVKRAVMF